MRRLKAKAALTASLLADDRERHWSRKDAPWLGSYRRSATIAAPVFCNKGSASAIGFDRPEETFSTPTGGELQFARSQHLADCAEYDSPPARGNALSAAPSSAPESTAALCSNGKRYKFAIWVTGDQRERIRSLATGKNQTIQEFLLATLGGELDRIARSE